MGWYIARRIAIMVPVFLGATLLIYGMVFLLPGDPVAAMAGDRPLTPAVAANLRARYHLDDPFLLQYLRYLAGVLRGDLGRSYSGLPIGSVLAHAFPVTLRLALIALTVEAVLGVGFGVVAGLRQGGIFDSTVLVTGLVIGAFQAATSINEQTLSFIPKLVAISAVLVFAGPWMLKVLVSYTRELFESIPSLIN